MADHDPGEGHDRRSTSRWAVLRMLIVPVVLLIAIAAGTQALVALAPGEAAADLTVRGVPPPALPERECRRDAGDRIADTIRADHPARGRVTSTQVLSCPAGYDGLLVTYAGELVGDLLHRDTGAWVLVNDDAYALERGPLPAHRRSGGGTNSGLSVWLPAPLAARVDDPGELGRPGRRGVVVLLTGTVQRADGQDGGRVSLRATSMSRLAPAATLSAPLHRPQAIVAGGLLVAVAGLVVVRRRSAR